MPSYHTFIECREWLMLGAELYVCYILKKEFEYDKDKYERQEERKRRKKASAKENHIKNEAGIQEKSLITEGSQQESVRGIKQNGIHARIEGDEEGAKSRSEIL